MAKAVDMAEAADALLQPCVAASACRRLSLNSFRSWHGSQTVAAVQALGLFLYLPGPRVQGTITLFQP